MKLPKFRCDRPSGLPYKYKFLGVLGEGVYGKVVKCLNKETNETVAIKMPKLRNRNEVSALKKIKCDNLDEHNIVKYIDCFETKYGTALVFESLDISVYDYIKRRNAPMLLSDIRTIIEQMATAFIALKGIQMIHTDVKLDNIMIVNHRQRPFEVKLIDFGLAVFTAKARRFETLQAQSVRSPEIMLRQEYDEAIDMWTLGCAMFQMLCGHSPFSGETNYEVMLSIVELLGQPADHVLSRNGCSTAFFIQNEKERSWRIKSPLEYFRRCHKRAQKSHKFQSLDDMKMVRLEKDNEAEAVEREQCIDLLKAMLTFDRTERITPREVLTHPFITKDYPNVQNDMVKTSRSLGSTSSSEPFKCQPPAAPLRDEDSINIQTDDCNPSPEILPSGVILVRPVTTVKTTLLEDQESIVSKPPAAPLRDEDSFDIQPDDCTQSPEILPPGVILVRPVTTENTLLLEDQQSTVSEPPDAPLKDEGSLHIQPDDCTQSPEILPSGVILVWPVAAENTTLLKDQKSTVSFQSGLNKTSESSVSNTDSNTKISEDSTTCEDTETKKKGKKKKNCFRRVLSWLRKTFSCRVSPTD